MKVLAIKTHSSVSNTPISRKLAEWAQQFAALVRSRNPFVKRDFAEFFQDVAAYDEITQRFVGRPLAECKTLEIGFGARPYRLCALHSKGIDVIGVDLDQPVLQLRDIVASFRANGFERALKSAVRYVLFDIAENRQLDIPYDRLVVSDAANTSFWQAHPGPYDFIYSEDVFEHIPVADLRTIIGLMADNMTNDGIALIRPMIWTGIMGGHFVEYFGYRNTDQTPSIEPWAHLRGLAPPANTYLNKLTRRDYVRLFSERFEILEERETEPGLGRPLLTDEILHETRLDEYELLSNNVRFALRPRKSP